MLRPHPPSLLVALGRRKQQSCSTILILILIEQEHREHFELWEGSRCRYIAAAGEDTGRLCKVQSP